MNRTALTISLVALLLWGVAATGVALRYRTAAAQLEELAANSQMDVEDLRAKLRKAEKGNVVTAPAPVIVTLTRPAAEAGTGTVAAADQRVLELESSLREKEAMIASLRRTGMTNRPPWEGRGPRDGQAWLDELKARDPKQYEEFVKRREEAQQRVQRAFAEKAAHFVERDTSKLTAEQKEAQKAMMSLLEDTWRLSEQLRADLPTEQRRELISSMRENVGELAPLMEQARETEFYLAGRNLGLSDAQSAQLVQQINTAVEVTSMRPIYEQMHGGRGGGGPGGPGR